MKRFVIQIVALIIFINLLEMALKPFFDMLIETNAGYAIKLTAFIALGWYWIRICNYFEKKFIGNK